MYEENSIDIASRPAILHGGESTRFQSGNNGRLQSQFSKWLPISPKRKIEGDTLHISADELLRMQQSQVISDRIIRFDKLKDLR